METEMTSNPDPKKGATMTSTSSMSDSVAQVIKGRYRTCQCPEVLVNGKRFYLEDGIIRTILEHVNPDWKYVPKSEQDDCKHWVAF